jgi:hypothetical protein
MLSINHRLIRKGQKIRGKNNDYLDELNDHLDDLNRNLNKYRGSVARINGRLDSILEQIDPGALKKIREEERRLERRLERIDFIESVRIAVAAALFFVFLVSVAICVIQMLSDDTSHDTIGICLTVCCVSLLGSQLAYSE